MKKLTREEYLDKMKGCWLGKCIGGTLGAPFEAHRNVQNLDYYTADLSKGMLPNDDLDLQLVWLNAAERFKTEITAEILSDYWLLGIIPNWAEYGVGKGNLRAGLLPPVSGKYNNRFKDSNGAWIRSEIWACLAPGHPEIAVKYAYEDACVDHADEGVYSEIFTAALESAAFAESDKFKLIDIALSFIPDECVTAKAVKRIVELYKSGLEWNDARIKIMNEYPSSFGGQLGYSEEGVVNGNWGFDAPNNVAITLIGWLWAEDDFGKAICITTMCGEDADCTAGTLAAILGIIMGAENIPEKWSAPIGDEIATICVSRFARGIKIPKTIDELCKRVSNLMPSFMYGFVDILGDNSDFITMNDGDALFSVPAKAMNGSNGWDYRYFKNELPTGYTFRAKSMFYDCRVEAPKGIELVSGEPLPLDLRIDNIAGFYSMPLYLEARFITPEGVSIVGGANHSIFVNQLHCSNGRTERTFEVIAENITDPMVNIVLELKVVSYATKIYVPITLVKK